MQSDVKLFSTSVSFYFIRVPFVANGLSLLYAFLCFDSYLSGKLFDYNVQLKLLISVITLQYKLWQQLVANFKKDKSYNATVKEISALETGYRLQFQNFCV